MKSIDFFTRLRPCCGTRVEVAPLVFEVRKGPVPGGTGSHDRVEGPTGGLQERVKIGAGGHRSLHRAGGPNNGGRKESALRETWIEIMSGGARFALISR